MRIGKWRKSSYSGNENCVEVAGQLDDRVCVRDSKVRASGPMIPFDAHAWGAFVGATR
ncbi:DUF397 domain-containing protein [Embleya sp. AB8]|uniref:DUF397 domain-containing protein n=1 Tax=Embleya sp. AB8 TaxID=3156304 RepID=UPI003C71FEC4